MAKYLVDSLKDDGLHTAKVTKLVYVWIGEVLFADDGTALAHPRAKDAPNRAMVESLKGGFRPEEPIIVRDGGMKGGKRRLLIIDGAQRKINGTVAENELNAAGLLAKTDGRYMVAVRVFDGDDLACLMERERCQSDNLKRPHSPSVLYASYAAMESLGATQEQIATVAPKGCDVSAMLRWPAVHTDVQTALDAHPSPLGMIAALLDVPRDEQPAAFAEMTATGATTPRKARNVARKRTGSEKPAAVHLPSLRAMEAMRGAVNGEVVKASFLLAFIAGDGESLEKASPALYAKLVGARDAASKPGRKTVTE